MEHTLNVEPTREEILEQLKKRELYVPNSENLSMDQLQQIYKAFIVPHPRRERRERQGVVTETSQKRSSEVPMGQLVQRINVVCMAGGKRPSYIEPQQLLCSAAKRIKVDFPR